MELLHDLLNERGWWRVSRCIADTSKLRSSYQMQYGCFDEGLVIRAVWCVNIMNALSAIHITSKKAKKCLLHELQMVFYSV